MSNNILLSRYIEYYYINDMIVIATKLNKSYYSTNLTTAVEIDYVDHIFFKNTKPTIK